VVDRNPAAPARPLTGLTDVRDGMPAGEMAVVIATAPHQAAALAFRTSAVSGPAGPSWPSSDRRTSSRTSW
jgi:hypothetical protein